MGAGFPVDLLAALACFRYKPCAFSRGYVRDDNGGVGVLRQCEDMFDGGGLRFNGTAFPMVFRSGLALLKESFLPRFHDTVILCVHQRDESQFRRFFE